VPIPNTEEDGICEARQVHLKCYQLMDIMGGEIQIC
jgi:hypothetical protein